jgi:hypothetical protein
MISGFFFSAGNRGEGAPAVESAHRPPRAGDLEEGRLWAEGHQCRRHPRGQGSWLAARPPFSMEGQARQRGRRPAAVEVVAARLHAICVEGGLNLVPFRMACFERPPERSSAAQSNALLV